MHAPSQGHSTHSNSNLYACSDFCSPEHKAHKHKNPAFEQVFFTSFHRRCGSWSTCEAFSLHTFIMWLTHWVWISWVVDRSLEVWDCGFKRVAFDSGREKENEIRELWKPSTGGGAWCLSWRSWKLHSV